MKALQFEPEVLETITAHAIAGYPNESCGFLLGSDDVDFRHLRDVLLVENSKEGDQRKRFEISPRDYMKAEREAAIRGLDLLGIYHSHPDHPAIPSRHDHKQAVPFFSYVILSIREGALSKYTSWQLDDNGVFVREPILNDQSYQIAIV